MFPRIVHKRDATPIDNIELQVTEHHDVLTRHGRIITSQSTQLIGVHEDVKKPKGR